MRYPETTNRLAAYVYYFHRAPKGFTGGAVALYGSLPGGRVPTRDDPAPLVEPLDNSLVVLSSRTYHEIHPIRCPSGAFADGRLAINGWVRRSS